MTGYWQLGSWKLRIASSFLLCGAIALSSDCAFAQITPDTTLGNENSTVTSTGKVDQIDGGATRGANLFHSFQEFNVGEGRAAVFTNPAGIENILSRVTGVNPSNIFGTLGVSGGNANLFLINPNGIVFGANARLDVGGSFVASTASSLKFADGTEFNATAHSTTSLLSVNVPFGLQIGGNASGILVQGSSLQVQPDKTLALLGGDVRLDGGTLQAPGGQVELGAVVGAGTVGLNIGDNNLRLSFPNGVAQADIFLDNGALVDASGDGGGDVQVQGRRVTLIDGSQIVANTLGDNRGGILSVTASESVELRGTSANGQLKSGLFALTLGIAKAGNLKIETGRLLVEDGAEVTVSSGGAGDAGNLDVTARSILLDNRGTLRAESASSNGGNIRLKADDLLLMRRNTQISITASSSGESGNLYIDTDFLLAGENSDFILNLEGQGGNFIVNTQFFLLSPDSDIIINSGQRYQLPKNTDFFGRSLASFPLELIDAPELIAQGCSATEGQVSSKFIITGRSGLPDNPSQSLGSDAIDVDLVTLNSEVENRSSSDVSTTPVENRSSPDVSTTPTAPHRDPIVEATGWVIAEDGEVLLTADAQAVTPHSSWQKTANCQQLN